MEHYQYKSPRTFALGAIILICITLLFSAASFYGSLVEWNIYGQYDPDSTLGSLSAAHRGDLSLIVAGVDLLKSFSFIISIVMFLLWTYRIHQNGHALKLDGIVNAPGWSVTVYFIPIVNFIMPLTSLLHVHKSGVKRVKEKGHTIRVRAWLLYSWWVLFWSSYIVSMPANFGSADDPIGKLRDQIPFFMTAEALYFLSGIFLLFVIKKVSTVQELVQEESTV